MQIHRTSVEVVIHTPAKLNLSFEVLARRTDGYHEIQSLMCPISLYDTVGFVPTENANIEFSCRRGSTVEFNRSLTDFAISTDPSGFNDIPQGTDNLVVKAVDLIRQVSGERQGAIVRLTKRIPSAAGLGGGSSDAAAALVAANLAWNLKLPQAELSALAAQLGSDVPFFLADGPAVCRGRGEIVEPVGGCWADFGSLHFVVVRPPEGLSTATVYRNCGVSTKLGGFAADRIEKLIDALHRGDLPRAGKLFFNGLQSAAEKLSVWITRLGDLFAREACLGHAMSGSGTAYFALLANAVQARRLALRLRSTGIGSVVSVRSCQ